jgi:hypothetical protein
VDEAMAEAAEGDHEAIVRLCHDEWGTDNVKDDIIWAAKPSCGCATTSGAQTTLIGYGLGRVWRLGSHRAVVPRVGRSRCECSLGFKL